MTDPDADEEQRRRRNGRYLIWFCAVGAVVAAVIAGIAVVVVRDYLDHRDNHQAVIVARYEKQFTACQAGGRPSIYCAATAVENCVADPGWRGNQTTAADKCAVIVPRTN